MKLLCFYASGFFAETLETLLRLCITHVEANFPYREHVTGMSSVAGVRLLTSLVLVNCRTSA